MANLIEEITNRLLLVNKTIPSKKAPEEIVFEDASVLGEFFADFQYTNHLIDAAEKQAQEEIHALIKCNGKLLDAISAFRSLDLQIWKQVDYKRIAKERDDINLKELRVVEDAATKLWKQYQSESNRLDMMPFDTPEFIQLDKKCDQSREDYYKAHELAEKQFDIYRKVMDRCAHVYYFEIQFLEILIDKIAHIAQSIMADAKRMEKEVGT